MKRSLAAAAICAALILLAGCTDRYRASGEEPYYQGPGYGQPSYLEPADEAAPGGEDPADEPGGEAPPDSPGHVHGVLTPFPGGATLDRASEEEMAAHPGAPRFVNRETGNWMAFRFDEPVSDVVFVSVSVGPVGFDDKFQAPLFKPGAVLYEAGDLAAGQPFFVQTYGHFGTLPAQAIGFTYTDGIRYYIPFDESQMDGSLVLWSNMAFTVDVQRSPRG